MSYSSTTNRLNLSIGVLILVGAAIYGFIQFGHWSQVKANLAQADEVLFSIEEEAQEVTNDYQKAKKDFLDEVLVNEEKIEVVFPEYENISDLTRAFDRFAVQNHYTGNPFFISQLSYGATESSDSVDYLTLPISMTIETSEANFNKFLEYIETSGSLENGIRLMSVNGLSLQINPEDKTLRVQLSISAYLQQ